MNVEWDFKEFTDFANKLRDTHHLNTALMTATQKVARVLHQYLLVQTPVVTGNLRKMWSAGDNLMFTVKKVNGGFEVTFINLAQTDKGFRYGVAVNDGHKTPGDGGWVMGRFFVERSVLQTANSKQIESIIMNELRKWWDSL